MKTLFGKVTYKAKIKCEMKNVPDLTLTQEFKVLNLPPHQNTRVHDEEHPITTCCCCAAGGCRLQLVPDRLITGPKEPWQVVMKWKNETTKDMKEADLRLVQTVLVKAGGKTEIEERDVATIKTEGVSAKADKELSMKIPFPKDGVPLPSTTHAGLVEVSYALHLDTRDDAIQGASAVQIMGYVPKYNIPKLDKKDSKWGPEMVWEPNVSELEIVQTPHVVDWGTGDHAVEIQVEGDVQKPELEEIKKAYMKEPVGRPHAPKGIPVKINEGGPPMRTDCPAQRTDFMEIKMVSYAEGQY